VPAFVWISLAVLIVGAAGGVAFAGLHGLRAWRALRSFQGASAGGLLELTRGIEGAEERLARAEESAARLDRARGRLRQSVAAAALMAASAGDARSALRLLGFLQR
jgi:hypothetical protein